MAFNLSLGNLQRLVFGPALPLVSPRARRRFAGEAASRMMIKTESVDTLVVRLSGGNQQKVLIGRWIERRPQVLILDEPTRGVDIGARGEIHRLVRELAGNGMAVLVISSEPDEIPELCDRVLVMAEGRIVAELQGAAVTRGAVIAASYGQSTAGDAKRGEAA